MIELFRHAVLVACLASLAIGVLASATMTLVQKSRTGLFRKLGNCNGVVGLSLLAVAMLFNGYPTYADKRRSGSAEEQARQSVRPEPEPSRTGTVCGDDDCTFGVRSAMDPDEAPEFGVWTNALETVRITGIAVGQTSVWMRVSCPGDAPVPSGMLDVFSARDCNADTWTPCGAVSVPASTNEVVIEAFLPGATTATHPRQFFRVGTKIDSDSDGLTDAFEHLVSHTSPSAFDTDGDGIPDGWEYENGLDPNLWPDAYADPDGDGIPDADEEWIYGTDPYFADSDWDGSPDNAEIAGGTDPLNRLSHLARVALSVTNISGTANLTNYFGFSSTPAGWDVTNACAAAHWGQTSIVVSETAGLYGKAFSDLNRNGVYDEDADVIQVVRLESEHVIVNAKITLGDVDGDGVADVTELAEGTNPYDPDSILIHSTIVITDRDAQHGITNFVSHFVSETSAVPAAINMFTSPTYYYPVAASAIDGKIYVRGFRDLDRNGVYDVASDGVFSYVLTASNNGRTIDIDIGDSDGDTIYDSVELSEGTSPTDRQNYCFNCEFEILDVFSPTNELLAEVTFGSNCLYGPVVQTNSTLSLNLGHLVTANGDQVVVTFWEDEDGNGQHDKGEASTAHRIAVQSHDMIYSSRLALGGFDSNHDGLPDWWQAIHNLQSGGYDDDDGDGLINLHEWWSGTDPCVPDGSNTVLSVAARSIDSRIDDRSPGMSQEIYQSYAENGHEGLFVRNDARWTFGIDTSCASPWHDGIGRHSDCAPTNTTVTAISKRHVIYANHFAYAMSTNLVYYFCGTDGSVITNRLVSLSGIAGDIGVGLLEHELPDTVTPAKFLPDDFEDYIVDGRYLPSLIIDQNEKAFVAELSSFTTYRTRGSLHSNIASRNGNRAAFAKNYIGGDSSSPRFLVVGNDVVILGTIWRGGPGSGCLAHLYRQEIQARMNQLCPGYSISEIDFSSYDKTNFRKGDCHD